MDVSYKVYRDAVSDLPKYYQPTLTDYRFVIENWIFQCAVKFLFPHLTDEERETFFSTDRQHRSCIAAPAIRVKNSFLVVQWEVTATAAIPIIGELSVAYSSTPRLGYATKSFQEQAIAYAEAHWPEELIEVNWEYVEEYDIRNGKVYCGIKNRAITYVTQNDIEALEMRGEGEFDYKGDYSRTPLPPDVLLAVNIKNTAKN